MSYGAAGVSAYDTFGGWQPLTVEDFSDCERDPYITPAGVTPEWVLQIKAAAGECLAGHPAGLERPYCGMFGCKGVRT